MPRHLLIYPRPLPEESLSSFLMRVAHQNDIPILDLWSKFNIKFKKTHLKDIHQLDIDPNRVGDTDALSTLLKVGTSREVNRMTFQPLFEKFLDDLEIKLDVSRRDFCQKLIDTTHRRYCPLCLAENIAYKLLWQVKEIEVCETHGISLLSTCLHCGGEQDLVHSRLAEGRCQYCLKNLYDEGELSTKSQQSLNDSHRKYRDWRYLIDPNVRLIPNIVESRRKSLAICLLFLAQQGGSQVDTSKIQGMTNEYANRLLRFVRDLNRPKRPTLSFALSVLRNLGISLIDFSTVQVPPEFVKSVLTSTSQVDKDNTYVCLAPWCKSVGTSHDMCLMNIQNGKLKGHDGLSYVKPYICLKCCTRYGYNIDTSVWREIDGLIDTGWVEVLPRLNQSISKRQISVELGITSYRVTQIAGYFARKGLLEDAKPFLPSDEIQGDLIRYFEPLKGEGTLIYRACKEYGWSQSQFWYLYYTSNVQEFLFVKSDRKRGPYKSTSEKMAAVWEQKFLNEMQIDLQNGVELSLERIAERLGCTKETITRYKLSRLLTQAKYKKELELRDCYWEKTKCFVNERLYSNERIYMSEYHRAIGQSEKWMKKRFPEILEWVKEQVPIASINAKQALLEQRIFDAKTVVRKLQRMGKPYGFVEVAHEMGLNPSLFTYYKELGGAVREAAVTTE